MSKKSTKNAPKKIIALSKFRLSLLRYFGQKNENDISRKNFKRGPTY